MRISLFTICVLFITLVRGQESTDKSRIGIYLGPTPDRFSRVFLNVGGTYEKSFSKNKKMIWSSSINYRFRNSFRFITHKESFSICSGFAWPILKAIENPEFLIGSQIGYLYEYWYKGNSGEFNINAAFLRLSAEVTFPIKSFDLGLLMYYGMGYGSRIYLNSTQFISGPVLAPAYGLGIILKYNL